MVALAHAWGLGLARAFVASTYAWSALAKTNGVWLSGGTLLALAQDQMLAAPFANVLAASTGARVGVAVGTVFLELSLPLPLLWRRSRRTALVAALAFHGVLQLALNPDVIGAAMAALLLAFSTDDVERSRGVRERR